MQIALNEAEQRLAKFLARSRYEAARKRGIANAKIGPQSNEQTDLEGIGAEIAFCKMFNVYPDLEVGHTPAEDAVLPSGVAVDIKSTKHPRGHLLAAKWKKPNVSAYVLLIGEFPRYRFAGMMPCEELLRTERLKNFGHGEGYAAKQEELLSMDELQQQAEYSW
jgi:hypothetical protein